jgi:hypothetical protein
MMFRIVCVFPVPGGPSITESGYCRARITALLWLILVRNGYTGRGISSSGRASIGPFSRIRVSALSG